MNSFLFLFSLLFLFCLQVAISVPADPLVFALKDEAILQPKRVLMIVGDLSEDYEVMVSYQALTMVGVHVDTTSPGRLAGEFIQTAVHDTEAGLQTYSEKRGHLFRLNANFTDVADIAAEKYDGLLVPGGRAPEQLSIDTKVLSTVRKFFSTGKPVGTICHGPVVLAAARVLEGRSCAGYIGISPIISLAGAKYVDLKADEATVDGNLVSAPTWNAHPSWLREFLKILFA